MTHMEPGWWTGVVGGAAVCVLGILVLLVVPRRGAAVWFGLFCVGFGGFYIPNNASGLVLPHDGSIPDWYPTFVRLSQLPFTLLQIVATVGMARVFPRPVDGTERVALWAGAATTATLAIITFTGSLGVLQAPETTWSRWLYLVVDSFRVAILYGFLVVLAVRFRKSDDGDLRRLTALTAAGLTFFVGYVSGHGRYRVPSGVIGTTGPELLVGATYFAAGLALAVFWLASMRGPDRRLARNLAWLTLGAMLVGLVLDATGLEAGGWSRVVTALFLAYAVLKHQLLGIDVKVRWTISKSTVAAMFIAVFFIASEGAQLLFGRQNELIGLAAAGALVFAMSPLQRLADRLAVKAVPVSIALPISNGKDDAFRSAVRLALRGGITRREEHDLALLADNLGLNAKRALELRDEVEQRGAVT